MFGRYRLHDKEQQHYSGRSMMYWTFDEYRQDRQEILFGPYVTLPYLLPPTLPFCQDAGECFQALYRKYVDASKIV